jgi:hypothetical protein
LIGHERAFFAASSRGASIAQLTTFTRDFVEHPNGTRVDYVYNRRNQLTSMLHKKAATVLLGLSYLLNPDGSRASIIEHTQALDANQVPIVDASGAPLLEQQRRTDYQYWANPRNPSPA